MMKFALIVVLVSTVWCTSTVQQPGRFISTLYIPPKPPSPIPLNANLEGIDFSVAHKIEARIASIPVPVRFMPVLSPLISKSPSKEPLQCPPPSVRLSGHGFDHELASVEEFERGSQSKMYKGYQVMSDGTVHRVVFKVISETAYPEVKRALQVEKAVLHAIRDSMDVAPLRLFPVDLVADCESRTSITVFAGELNLFAFNKRAVPAAQLAAIAAAALALIRAVHSLGIVHGDIFESNFVFHGDLSVRKTLRLVDFGRATLFVNPTHRAHIPNLSALHSYQWDRVFVDPFELEGFRPSRRGDVFRLAETLIRLAVPDYIDVLDAQVSARRNDAGGRKELAEYKKRALPYHIVRQLPSGVFADFRTYALTLAFDERPNYESWIAKFEALAGDALNRPVSVA